MKWQYVRIVHPPKQLKADIVVALFTGGKKLTIEKSNSVHQAMRIMIDAINPAAVHTFAWLEQPHFLVLSPDSRNRPAYTQL